MSADPEREDSLVLLVAHPPSLGPALLSRLAALSPSSPSPSPSPDADAQNRAPFTLSNKYYTAPLLIQLQPLSPFPPPGRPLWPPEVDDPHARAVLWVFQTDQHDASLFDSVLPALDGHEPEVRLAVGVKPPGGGGAALPLGHSMSRGTRDQEDIDEDEEDDEQEALERFFLEREFEYVDADSNSHDHDDRQEEGLHNDVTGLRRVLDSLSTVMWPSMVRLPARPGLALGGSGPSSALSWEEDVEEEEEDEDAEVEAHVAAALQALGKLAVGRDTFEGRLAQAKYQEEAGSEREALEMWLEEGVQPSEARSREELGAEGKEEEFGQLVGSGSVGKGWAELEEEENGSGEGYAALEEDEEGEDGLPSEGEILRAHLEIFGPPPPPASSSAVLIPAARSTEPPVDPEHAGQTFDLSSALGALQSMRDEIRGMTDERERRRAAARVALGLVHGLGLEEGDLDEVMRHA